jgi:paraquat-inducible protein A
MRSLAQLHPWRLDIPALLGLSMVLLQQGLTQPAMEMQAKFLFFVLWRDEYSILSNIAHFWEQGRPEASLILAACSVAYPLIKILMLFYLLLAPFPPRCRRRVVRLLRLLGRWSLVDVMAVAAIVLGSRVIFLLEARPLRGLYVYAVGILVLMFATMLMDRLAREKRRRRR